MDQDIKDRLDEQLDFIKSRASKEEVGNLRYAFYWVIGVAAVAALSAVGAGFNAHSAYGKVDGRIIAIETQMQGVSERQQENNEILKEIERLLRENR